MYKRIVKLLLSMPKGKGKGKGKKPVLPKFPYQLIQGSNRSGRTRTSPELRQPSPSRSPSPSQSPPPSPSPSPPPDDEANDDWPVDTSLMECKRRNSIIRPYIVQRDWHMSLEFILIRNLVLGNIPQWTPYAEKYHYLFDYEWTNPSGKGDLIFSDGQNNFLIVEVKTMKTDIGASTGIRSRERRRRKKRHVEEQADKYSSEWHRLNPQVKTTTGIIATENGIRIIRKLTKQDRSEEDDNSSLDF